MPIITSRNILQFLVVITYLVLITLSPSVHFINYIEFNDCQRVIQLLLLSLVLLDGIFIGLGKPSKIPVNNKTRFGLFALLGLGIASTAHSIEPRHAVIELTIFAALCYFALFVARLYGEYKEKFIKALIYALWISILLYMVSFYTGYITAMVFKKTLIWPYPFYGFSNIRLFQQYQLWVLGLVCLPLLAFNLSKRTLLWLNLALACWWVLLFYAASRGVIVAWLIAMVVTTILYRNLAWPFLRMQLINAGSGLIGYLFLFKLIPALVAPTASAAIVTSTIFRDVVTDRMDLWKVSLVMVKNFPFFGVGPMQFYFYNTYGTHPHNSVLQLAAEWGLPATFIIVALAAYGLYCWLKRFNKSALQNESKLKTNLAIILLFTITASAAYSLVDGVIIMPISQVLMFTMIGLMIGQYTEGTWSTEVKRKLRFKPIFAGVVLVLMALSTMPELLRGLTSYERYLQLGERAFSMGPGINPRIWMQQQRIENNQP